MAAPYRINVEAITLKIVYNVLQTERFAWFCSKFGAGGVTKLRSFLTLNGNEINPRHVELDLDKGVLFYRPVGASESDLVQSSDWAGDDFDDVVNALNYAKHVFLAVNKIRDDQFAGRASWAETLAFAREFDATGLGASDLRWSVRGALFAPQSDPGGGLAMVERTNAELARYARQLEREWLLTRAVTGRITEIPSPGMMTFTSLSGAEKTYSVCNFVVDAKRSTIFPRSLEIVSDKSPKGVLAELRYVEENGRRIVVNCQLPSVTTSLIDGLTGWDGTDASAIKLLADIEAANGAPVIGYSKKSPNAIARRLNPATKQRWLKNILGF